MLAGGSLAAAPLEPDARRRRRRRPLHDGFLVSKFLRAVDSDAGDDECWPARVNVLRDGPRVVTVARAALELAGRAPRPGEESARTCGNRNCANPRHLEAIPPAERIRRSWERRRALQAQSEPNPT